MTVSSKFPQEGNMTDRAWTTSAQALCESIVTGASAAGAFLRSVERGEQEFHERPVRAGVSRVP